jgi:sialidase-1
LEFTVTTNESHHNMRVPRIVGTYAVRRRWLRGLSHLLLVCTAELAAACHHTAVRRDDAVAFVPQAVDLDLRGMGAPVFRIPALAVTRRGTVLAAYDARPTMADVPSHIAVVLRRSTDGGRTWGPRETVRSDSAPLGFGDPSFVVDQHTGRVFLFHVASIRQGFFGSGTGNRDDDPNILHLEVSASDDDGKTWQHRRLTSQVKDPAWGGLFGSSGAGVQLALGRHRGRLLQPVVIKRADGVYAASLISDDHGATWRMGALVGPGMDEHELVELPDGTVRLDSRARPFRLVADSHDGGESYSALRPDSLRVDPANNAGLLAVDRGARRALLFSNTADRAERQRLTVRMSCDNGRTWPFSKVMVPGPSAYSTMALLDDHTVGMLYERGPYEAISFVRFPVDWLGTCR